jgi:TfoX N-terminal domain
MSELDPALLLQRVRAALPSHALEEKRIFGGVCLMLYGNMLCHASKKGLMVRVGKEQEDAALRLAHFAPCDGAGHAMPGFVIIAPEGLLDDEGLKAGLKMAMQYVSALPIKKPKATATKPKLVSHHP